MHGVYIHVGSDTVFSGVEKKIQNQIKALSSHYEMREIIIRKSPTNPIRSIGYRLPFGSFGREYAEAKAEIMAFDSVDFFYIRDVVWDRKMCAFFSWIRETHPDSKVILEIPSYPYRGELLSSATMWPWYFKDPVYKRKAHLYVDRIATLTEDKTLFGVDTLKFMNGLDVSAIKPIERDNETDTIRMIVVAMMQKYHGYERLLNGLATYYAGGGQRRIEIRMVGYGPEMERYEQIVRDNALDEYVSFSGRLEGDALDAAYEECDLAVGSMGAYKIGLSRFGSIKLGEYLAKGLPVITGAPTYPFYITGAEYDLEFPNDPSEIDMYKVIEFYDRLYAAGDKRSVRESVRKLAYETVDISVAMKSVAEYIAEENI